MHALPIPLEGLEPVSSASTIESPYIRSLKNDRNHGSFISILTFHSCDSFETIIPDNFGASFYLASPTYPVNGVFETLCVAKNNIPEYNYLGTKLCPSVADAFRALSSTSLYTIADFSALHTPKPCSPFIDYNFSGSFNLFIGSHPSDRINFWNSRHLHPEHESTFRSLIIPQEFFSAPESVEAVAQYISRFNYPNGNSSIPSIVLHSTSLDHTTLEPISIQLRQHTKHTKIELGTIGKPIVPNFEKYNIHPFKRIGYSEAEEKFLHKTVDRTFKISPATPKHFSYVSPKMNSSTKGQWVVDLSIQRHNNHSTAINIVDKWILPRRVESTKAFTRNLARINISGTLSVIPSIGSVVFDESHRMPSLEISLPSDEVVFQNIISNQQFYYPIDVRKKVVQSELQGLNYSDKGRNFRGVVAKFGKLSLAYEYLGMPYWEQVLKSSNPNTNEPLTWKLNELEAMISSWASEEKIILQERLRYRSPKKLHAYLRASLRDALSSLVKLEVMYMTHNWRCSYCGNMNTTNLDRIKRVNSCSVCNSQYFTPINPEWKFKVNDFIYRSMVTHSGLMVLWTLGYLHSRPFSGNFFFMPEVDLYQRDGSTNEIDALCVINGLFYAIEAKETVRTFIHGDGDVEKFIKVVNLIQPDVALLSFGKYGHENDDLGSLKDELKITVSEISKRIHPSIKLRTLVKSEIIPSTALKENFGCWGEASRLYEADY